MTPFVEQPGAPSQRSMFSVPHLAWDGILVVVALVIWLAFRAAEDVSGPFWDGFSLQAAVGLLGALALYISVSFGVPNLAVAGIAVFASSAGVKIVGFDGSWLLMIVVGAIIGILIGLALATLVVGLRIPAWAASIGVTGLLVALAVRILFDGRPEPLRPSRTLFDWGAAIFFATAVLAIVACFATAWLLSQRANAGVVVSDDDGVRRRDGSTMLLQAGALILSSAIAAVAGVLFSLRVGVVDGRIGNDLARPLAIFLLAGVSLRGRGNGFVGLVAATVIIEVAATWTLILGQDSSWIRTADQLVVAGAFAFVGLIVGAILEFVSNPRPAPNAPVAPPPAPAPVGAPSAPAPRPTDARFVRLPPSDPTDVTQERPPS